MTFAEEALGELRGGRYGARAWWRFLARSLRRSRDDAARYPRAAGRVLVVGGWGALIVGVVAVSHWDGPRALLAAAFWLAVVSQAWWHVGMLERDWLGVANVLSLARALLVPLLFYAGGAGAFLGVFGAGAVLDVADGRVARWEGSTRFGEHADHVTDVWFYTAAAAAAGGSGWLPSWLWLLVAARYVLPAALLAAYYFTRAASPPRGTWIDARHAGAVLSLGLLAAPLPAARPVGLGLVVVGAAWAFASTGRSAVRVLTAAPDGAAPRRAAGAGNGSGS